MAVSFSRQIPPGGKGQISAKIKTAGEAGNRIEKQLLVYTNDPQKPKLTLTISGNVIPPARIEPKAARLIGIAGEQIQTDVTITPQPGHPFDITKATARDGKQIRFRLEKMTNGETPCHVLHVQNTQQTPGRYADAIILATDSPIIPEITVRVFGIIRDRAQ